MEEQEKEAAIEPKQSESEVKTSEAKSDESLLKELSELREFKSKIESQEARATESVKEYTPVMDSLLSKDSQTIKQRPSKKDQYIQEMLDKGYFYRGEHE